MDCYSVYLQGLFFFVFFCFDFLWFFFVFLMIFFSKLSLILFFLKYWAGWEFSFIVFFSLKHCGLLQCFSIRFFFYDFFQNYFCPFYFFDIELVENYNYIFPYKILWIATVFPYMVYFFFVFLWFFFQNYLCWFFLILSRLRI
jgi:hypothetical protein